jgi:hypothetical protein
MKLRDRFFLWRNFYCTRHLAPKSLGRQFSECRSCIEEREISRDERIQAIIAAEKLRRNG